MVIMLAFLASLASSLARIHQELIELKIKYTSQDLIEVTGIRYHQGAGLYKTAT